VYRVLAIAWNCPSCPNPWQVETSGRSTYRLRTQTYRTVRQRKVIPYRSTADPSRVRLAYDDPVLHSKLDEIGVRLKAEILHDSVFMKRYGAWGYIQDPCGFFHRLPLSQELDDFSLTDSQRFRAACALRIANERLLHSPGYLRCDVALPTKCHLHGLQ